jgi:PAS domain S-box-containing protein
VLGRIIEMPARRADGSEFPVDLYIVGIPIEGKPMFTGFARDISERKLREQELRDERARLANLVEAAVTAIITINNHGLVGNANPATEKLFGYTEAELVGRNVHMLMPEPYHSQHDGYLRNYLGTGDKKIIGIGREVMGRRKDGTTFPIHLAVSEFEASGQRYFTGIIHDLSDRKNAEEALRESEWRLAQVQKMEAVGQLSGGVAHDFNNLLTVIGGNLELYMNQLPASVDQRLLNDAKDAVDMGARLTERLLTFSRQRSLAPVLINLNELTLGMSELLRRTLGETIDFSATLASDLWPVRADVSGIENTILNLAINARDAMPRGGRLIIESQNLSVGEGDSEKLAVGDFVLLSVSDSGTGMSPETVTRAFEPFFSTKEPGKGTGLGLASVYGFVKQSGGHAEVYSEIGTGTTVNIYLPRDKSISEPFARERPHPSAKPTVERTILVVEDNPLVRRLTVRRVETLGYRVLEADSGPSALKVMRLHGDVDLIFSDVVMAGGMSGLELARTIREERPDQKILLTTGFAEEIARSDSVDALLRILRKPYDQARLSQAIENVMTE